MELVRSCERVARELLRGAGGGESLCSPSSGPVPAVKYREGAATALAEARRSISAVADGPGWAPESRAAVDQVRASWLAQSRLPSRTAPGWVGYLAGGLEAIDGLIGAAVELGVRD